MICIKCYQEIPDGSKFCPHCGAQQPDTTVVDHADTQANTAAQPDTVVQPDADTQPDAAVQPDADTQPDAAVQPDAAAQPDVTAQPDAAAQSDTQYQNQNTYTSDYQNSQYQTPPVYQSSYEPEKPVNWVPYLVLSIVSLVCCCGGFPFAIVGIVYSVKINNATAAGNHEEARKAAKLAKIWIIVAFVVGIIVDIIYALMIYAGAFGSYYYYY